MYRRGKWSVWRGWSEPAGRNWPGLYRPDSGTMELLGRPWQPKSPWEALEAGLVYLPEERKREAAEVGAATGAGDEDVGLLADAIRRAGGSPMALPQNLGDSGADVFAEGVALVLAVDTDYSYVRLVKAALESDLSLIHI